MELPNFTEDKTESILKKFAAEKTIRTNVIFCMACGSTSVDQYSLTTLCCSSCGNECIWNALKFGIARNGDISDVKSASTPIDPFYLADWRSQMFYSLEEFMQAVNSTIIGPNESVDNNSYQTLAEQWEVLQSRVQRLFQGIELAKDR